MRLFIFAICLLLTGCLSSLPYDIVAEQIELENLPPAERCEKIRIDLREDCRKKQKKEVDELSKSMSKKY